MNINFTPHAERKLSRLTAVGITKSRVIATIRHPTKVVPGYWGRKIAQGPLSRGLVLRGLRGIRPGHLGDHFLPDPTREVRPMIARYDRVSDTLDLILSQKQIHHAEEHGPIVINYDRQGEPVEIELLGASRLLGELLASLLRAQSEASRGPTLKRLKVPRRLQRPLGGFEFRLKERWHGHTLIHKRPQAIMAKVSDDGQSRY